MALRWLTALNHKSGSSGGKFMKKTTRQSAFPQLSNADIDNIIAYTSEPKVEALCSGGGAASWTCVDNGTSNNIILGALALVMLVSGCF
jgi:hypothetical protein